MAIVLNTGQGAGSTSTPETLSYTANASDTRAIIVSSSYANPGQNTSSAPTYNGVSATLVGSYIDTATTFRRIFIHYLDNPNNTLGWGGALTLSQAWPGSPVAYGLLMVSMSGADLSQAPVIGAGVYQDPVTTATMTLSGAGANDLYLGGNFTASATAASGGSQVRVASALNINGGQSLVLDSLPGSGSGAFSWTTANGQSLMLGVTIRAPGAGLSALNPANLGPGAAPYANGVAFMSSLRSSTGPLGNQGGGGSGLLPGLVIPSFASLGLR